MPKSEVNLTVRQQSIRITTVSDSKKLFKIQEVDQRISQGEAMLAGCARVASLCNVSIFVSGILVILGWVVAMWVLTPIGGVLLLGSIWKLAKVGKERREIEEHLAFFRKARSDLRAELLNED